MILELYQVDAFTKTVFKGNPAAVVPLQDWLEEDVMQSIATENNLSETVFFVPKDDAAFHIRWFTPVAEVRLCGHATLAAAHVLWNEMGHQQESLLFESLSGPLQVERDNDLITLDFPSSELSKVDRMPGLTSALGGECIELIRGRDDFLALVEDQKQLLDLRPDFGALSQLPARGLIVTAPGDEEGVDFVSRCFYPKYGVDEDPVTGSAHTLLTPYWANRLGVDDLRAKQLSKRGGELMLQFKGERTKISGHAVTFLKGSIRI